MAVIWGWINSEGSTLYGWYRQPKKIGELHFQLTPIIWQHSNYPSRLKGPRLLIAMIYLQMMFSPTTYTKPIHANIIIASLAICMTKRRWKPVTKLNSSSNVVLVVQPCWVGYGWSWLVPNSNQTQQNTNHVHISWNVLYTSMSVILNIIKWTSYV